MTVEEKRSVIQLFEKKGKTTLLLQWCGLSHSTYYYHPCCGKRGRKPSTQTLLSDGNLVQNESVVICIRFVLSEEFMLFTGYVKICKDLQSYGFVINKKKVYRLMKEHHLLCGVVIRTRGEKRQFVSYCVQEPVRPMEQLCMDIKYVYIHGENRNALLLTVLDVYSRSILSQVLWWRIRKEQVIWLLHKLLQQHSTKGITLRNDNGSQFIAHAVQEYLQEKEVTQEFTHVATPEENCLSRLTTAFWTNSFCRLLSFRTSRKPLPYSAAGACSTTKGEGMAVWVKSHPLRCGSVTKQRTLNHRVKRTRAMLGSNPPGITR